MFPAVSGRPLSVPAPTPQPGAAFGGQGSEGESSTYAAVNVPSVITFVTGNAKKRKEVEEILLTYQTSFELVAEKVRGSTCWLLLFLRVTNTAHTSPLLSPIASATLSSIATIPAIPVTAIATAIATATCTAPVMVPVVPITAHSEPLLL